MAESKTQKETEKQAAKAIPGLRTGRTVHFVDGKVNRDAVVIRIRDAAGAADLEIFPNGGKSYLKESVAHDKAGKDGTWHLIEA